jgi:hypothetical protein
LDQVAETIASLAMTHIKARMLLKRAFRFTRRQLYENSSDRFACWWFVWPVTERRDKLTRTAV